MTPPLVVDIDGTLTDAERAVDPRVFPVLREWDAPVVVATGKALPYPVALCEFLGIPTNVIAENGGAVFVEAADELVFTGDPEAAMAVAEAYRERGYEIGFGSVDLSNRWRETELTVSRESPREPLEELAAEHGLEVVDTGFAYHVKYPGMDKATGLTAAAERLDRRPEEFVAVGDSANDAAVLDSVSRGYAVANADDAAKGAADEVVDATYADGFLAAVDRIRDRSGGRPANG